MNWLPPGQLRIEDRSLMLRIKSLRYGGETTGASVLDRPTVQERVSTGRMHVVKVLNIPLPTATVGSSGGRRRARRPTGSTSLSFQKSVPTAPTKGLTDRFRQLSNEWKRDTGHLSLISQIAAHPSYQAIIAMGEPAIPLILRDLEQEPNHWFSALSAIVDEGPEIPVHERGDISALSEAWLNWGKSKQYID